VNPAETGGDPAATTLPGLLDSAVRSRPHSPALVAGALSSTFVELRGRAAALAAGLRRRGSPGDRVALLSENRPEVVEAYYGVPGAGMLLAPLNHRLHAAEWCTALGRLEPAVLVGEIPLLDRLEAHPGAAAALAAAGTAVLPREGVATRRAGYEELLAPGAPGEWPGPGPAPEDPAWLIGTSGTTGPPKHAVLTHASLLAAARATAVARGVRPGDVLLTPFPLCHVAGYNVLVHHLHGGAVVLMRRFDPARLLELVREHGVTTLSLAPTMISMLLDHLDGIDRLGEAGALDRRGVRAPGGRHPAVPPSLRSIGYGASPIHPDLLRRGLEVLGCELSQGYGMTELSGNAVFLGPDAHRRAASGDERLVETAGWPAPGVELRISPIGGSGAGEGGAAGPVVRTTGPAARPPAVADPAEHRDGPDPGRMGEILVRAEQVAAGYWRDPDATAATFVDGWLRTGDVGRIDADGLLHVLDRAKDVVVTGGENVASREVEDVLRRHPSVLDVAVVGVPDPRWGERVCAVVVVRPGATSGAADLAAELEALGRAHLAGFKIPRRFEMVGELPRNATGKVEKARLREELGAAGPGR